MVKVRLQNFAIYNNMNNKEFFNVQKVISSKCDLIVKDKMNKTTNRFKVGFVT